MGNIEIRCSQCNATSIYTTRKERVCRKCGYRENLLINNEKKEGNDEVNTQTSGNQQD